MKFKHVKQMKVDENYKQCSTFDANLTNFWFLTSFVNDQSGRKILEVKPPAEHNIDIV